MLDINRRVRVIQELTSKGDPTSLTYAALECRLALEAICYERLRNNHKYLSHDDLRKWQPGQVINQLIQEIEPDVAKAFTLYVARGAPKEISVEGYNELEWVPLGEQSALPVRQMSKLWYALSKIALHVSLPQSQEDEISIYAEPSELMPKIHETVQVLQEIAKGNLLGGSFGPDRVFQCNVGGRSGDTRRYFESQDLFPARILNARSPISLLETVRNTLSSVGSFSSAAPNVRRILAFLQKISVL